LLKKKDYSTLESIPLVAALEELLPLMQQVYSMTERKEIKGETVPNDEKIFSIYELHTDIIVKGSRDVQFGHKINLTDCKSKLILDCQVLKGNPSDKSLLQASVDNIIEQYEQIPKLDFSTCCIMLKSS
jgi:IS5 family transposase